MVSPWARASKILASLLGCLVASVLAHLALALWIDKATFLSFSIYGIFILWVGLMLCVYWIKQPWKAWSLLMGIIAISAVLIYVGKL